MREMFEENQSELLHGVIIWTPMLMADSLDAAKQRETKFSDARLGHYWDPDRILGGLLSRTLNLKAPIAWDVYLVYQPGHAWDTELPPAPEFWMHQLDEDPALTLAPLRLKSYVQMLVLKRWSSHD